MYKIISAIGSYPVEAIHSVESDVNSLMKTHKITLLGGICVVHNPNSSHAPFIASQACIKEEFIKEDN